MTQAEREARDRALAYVRSKTDLASAAVHEQVAAAFASLDAVLSDIRPDRALGRPGPSEWSPHEVVDHLVETFRPGVDELRCLLAGEHAPGDPIPASLQSKAPHLRPWPWLLEELRRTERDVLDLLARVPEGFDGKATAPIVMVVNVPGGPPLTWNEHLEWKAYALVSWRLHTIDHMKQIRRCVAG